jgi:hypothetical protein
MPVLFNSITQFIESVGRRTVQEKLNSLDQIDAIFTGPSAYAQAFLPAPRSPHPQFPLMYCARAEITAREGLVAVVSTSYVGKLAGAPGGLYIGAPDIDCSRHIGSISYTTSVSVSPIQIATYSYTVRFTAKAVTFKYLTNKVPPPGFDGYFVTQAQPYLGVENLTTFKTAIVYSTGAPEPIPGLYEGYLTNTLVFDNDLTNVGVQDLDNGWYQVAETYQTQAYINPLLA